MSKYSDTVETCFSLIKAEVLTTLSSTFIVDYQLRDLKLMVKLNDKLKEMYFCYQKKSHQFLKSKVC